MKTGIHLRDLRKSFRSGNEITPVLKGIDLDIQAGGMFFIVGPSGCGKTTLISLICGTLRADSGTLEVLGHELHAMRDAHITRFRARHVGFVFQQFNLIPTLTLAQNVAVPLRLLDRSPREAQQAALEMLDRVGLADKAREHPANLSGGQQQRVAIARALVHQPELVVCDEPTSALDSETGRHVMDLLMPQKGETSRTVLVVTHDPRTYHYADHIAEMEDGLIGRVLDRQAAATHLGFSNSNPTLT